VKTSTSAVLAVVTILFLGPVALADTTVPETVETASATMAAQAIADSKQWIAAALVSDTAAIASPTAAEAALPSALLPRIKASRASTVRADSERAAHEGSMSRHLLLFGGLLVGIGALGRRFGHITA